MIDDHGTKYEPWLDGDMVGYRITRADGSVRYLYFNPSDNDSDGKSNVFLYFGETGEPSEDGTIIFVRVDPEIDKPKDPPAWKGDMQIHCPDCKTWHPQRLTCDEAAKQRRA